MFAGKPFDFGGDGGTDATTRGVGQHVARAPSRIRHGKRTDADSFAVQFGDQADVEMDTGDVRCRPATRRKIKPLR